MTPAELHTAALARLSPEAKARAAAIRGLDDLDLSVLARDAAEVAECIALVDEIATARAAVEARERAVEEAEKMLGALQARIEAEAKALGVSL